ncbi:hypothetical protein GCM10027048_14090 [Hymenobacter coalescens]
MMCSIAAQLHRLAVTCLMLLELPDYEQRQADERDLILANEAHEALPLTLRRHDSHTQGPDDEGPLAHYATHGDWMDELALDAGEQWYIEQLEEQKALHYLLVEAELANRGEQSLAQEHARGFPATEHRPATPDC